MRKITSKILGERARASQRAKKCEFYNKYVHMSVDYNTAPQNTREQKNTTWTRFASSL